MVQLVGLRGKRLVLMPITNWHRHTDFVVELRNHPAVARWFFNREPIKADCHVCYLRGLDKNHDRLYVAESLDHTSLIGMAGIDIDWRNMHAEFGRFAVHPQYWGNGYGKEILDIVLRHAFRDIYLNRVWLKIMADNEKAVSLYESYGFAEEGRLHHHAYKDGVYHDVLIMALTAWAWVQRGK